MEMLEKVTAVKKLVQETNGKLFNVTFTKKDGSERHMTCRTGVSKHVKGNTRQTTAKRNNTLAQNDMMTVFEMSGDKAQYRCINARTVTDIKCGKNHLTF